MKNFNCMIDSFRNKQASILISSLLILLMSPLISYAQDNARTNEPISEDIINQTVNDFLTAVNSGNRDIMSDFISRRFSINMLKNIPSFTLVALNLSFYYTSGGLGYELIKIEPVQDNLIKAELYNKLTRASLIFEIPISGLSLNNINGFINAKLIEPSTSEGNLNHLDDREIINRINQVTQKLIKDEEFSGAILVARNGKILIDMAIGEASKSYDIPNKTDTKFNMASVGKIFTGLAVMQLAEQGKLNYEDTLSKYLPEGWLSPEVSKKIQIKHLLTHTCGLGDYFNDAYKQCAIPFFRDLEDYKLLITDDTLLFEPGTNFSYSNTGMLLLGVVIENITHQKYFDYLKKNIFEPCGMINTDGFHKDRPVKNMATGYTKMYENDTLYWDNHQFTRVMRGSSSGGIYSTVEDMLKFDIALRSNKLLSPENTRILFEGRPELNASFHSYGFFVSHGICGRIASHQGDGRGVNCQFKMYLDLGYTIVVLSNYSQPSANIVANALDQLIIYR